MKKLLTVGTVAAALVAAADDNYWKIDPDTGSASGSVTEDAHWTLGAASTEKQRIAPLTAAQTADYTVTFPKGYVSPGSGLALGVAANQTLRLTGGDYLTTTNADNRAWTTFSLNYYNGGWNSAWWIEYMNDTTRKAGGLNWFDISAIVSVTNSCLTADFTGGDLTATNAEAKSVMFYSPSTLKTATITFRDGAKMRLKGDGNGLMIYENFDTNRLVFVGGDHLESNAVWFKDDSWRIQDGKDAYTEMRLTDGAKFSTGTFNFGGYVSATPEVKRLGASKRRRLIVEKGSSLVGATASSFHTMETGTAEVLVTGPGSRMQFDNFALPMSSSERGVAQAVSTRFVATDGACVKKHGSSYAFTIGTADTYGENADCPTVVAVTNATLDVDSTLQLYAGELLCKDSVVTNNVLRLGCTTTPSIFDLAGGELWSASISAIGYTGVGTLTASDGARVRSEAKKLWIGQESGSMGTLVLKGGAVFSGFELAGGSGASSLVSDGGVIRATKAAPDLLHGISSATITANGLTVESDYDVTIAQSLANATDEQGVLCLRGAGVKTLGGTASNVSVIDVPEGSLVFTDAARFASSVIVTNGASVAFGASATEGTLKGLQLGDAESTATLVLTPNQKIAVAGPVALEHLRVSLLDGFAAGTYTVIEATGAVSATTREAWANTLVTDGTPAGLVATFASSEADGTTTFTMTLAAIVERRITVAANTTQTVETVVSYGANETLTVDVGDQASATIAGKLGTGNLVKEGRGILRLTSVENDFLGSLSSWGGLFSVPNLLALGYERFGLGSFTLGGGTLELGEANAAEQRFPYELIVNTPKEAIPGVVIKTESDVVMAAPTMQSGAILKRGAGRLAFEVGSGDHTLTVTNAYAVFNDAGQSRDLVFDDFGNVPTDNPGYTGLNVLEGELVLRGTESGAQLTAKHTVNIGLSPTTGSANPGFVLDNVKLVQGDYGNYFNFACGISTKNPFAQSPYLYVTNNATLTCSLHVSCNSDTRNPRLAPRILVDHSILKIGTTQVSGDWHYPEWTFQNDARFYSKQLYGGGRDLVYVFDASICAKNEDLDPLEFYDSYLPYRHGATFRNGSLFCCNALTCDGRGSNSCTNIWSFNNSEWRPVKSGDFAFSFTNVWNQLIRVTGTGIILAPPEDATWRMAIPVRGEGGLVKRGAGTLVFDTNEAHGAKVTEDPLTLDCEGTVAVEAGTLRVLAGSARAGLSFDVADGATLELASDATLANATVTGAGTVTGGSIAGLTIVPGATDTPTFDGALLGGAVTVDFARTAENPLERGTYVVAHYTGAAPSLAGWKAKGYGCRGLKVAFSAANGDITAHVYVSGMMVIVR